MEIYQSTITPVFEIWPLLNPFHFIKKPCVHYIFLILFHRLKRLGDSIKDQQTSKWLECNHACYIPGPSQGCFWDFPILRPGFTPSSATHQPSDFGTVL